MTSRNSSGRNVRPKLSHIQERCNEFQQAVDAMREEVAEMEQKMAQWNGMENRIQENIANTPNIITLDVGGTIFKTSKETLLRFEGSYFHALLGSGQWKPDTPNAAYFLDLDASLFRRIMLYLRTGELSFNGLCGWECKELKSIVEYLNLGGPKEHCLWDPNLCALDLSKDMKTVEHGVLDGWRSVMGDTSVKSIQIKVLEGSKNAFIGLAPRQGFNPDTTHCHSFGYSIHLMNGQVCRNGAVLFKRTKQFYEGDVLTIRQDGNTIRFKRNDRDIDVEVVIQEMRDLFPVVSLYDELDKVAIIE
ncbi:hypothetical protein AC1031_011028 [Aphanomyces cochlioides]|nr:hypothetical protein AC1031_011028 [Aphanomyces cochlioides]